MVSEFISNYFPSFISILLLYLMIAVCYGSYLFYKDGRPRTRSETVLIVIASAVWPATMFILWLGQWVLDGME